MQPAPRAGARPLAESGLEGRWSVKSLEDADASGLQKPKGLPYERCCSWR
jgi:hypothetical protein